VLIIGLGHKARHGKNYVATEIVKEADKHGLYAKEYGFAHALKAYCRVAYGMRKKDPELLQVVGTNIFRKYQPDVWVEVLLAQLDEERPDIAVISDVRFPNEAEAIRHAGGLLYKITRLADRGVPYVAPDRDPFHPSETALDDYLGWEHHFAITNGNTAGLKAAAQEIVARVTTAAKGRG
jgi:hypothetical protein